MASTFTIYVDTYVKTIDGQFKPAGRDHAIEYKVDAADAVTALIVFRQNHPSLIASACEEDLTSQKWRVVERTCSSDAADAISYGLQTFVIPKNT